MWRAPLTAVAILAVLAAFQLARPLPAAASTFRVVLDAGHGGKDPGASSSLLAADEADITLRLALLTGAALQRRGVDVVYTRTTDRDVGLAARVALAERVGAHAMVSLHLNSAPDANARGVEAWYGDGQRDASLAGALLDSVSGPWRAWGGTIRGTRSGPFLAVLKANMPAALIEVGYVTNAADARLLADGNKLSAIADALAQGIVRFRDAPPPSATTLRTLSVGAGAAVSVPNLYFARLGDTLSGIATAFGLPVAEIERLNPLVTAQALQVGQPVQVRTAGPAPSGAATGIPRSGLYVVAPGDTLSAIALRFGLETRDLVRWNGLKNADTIRVGDSLRLTASVSATATSAPAAGGAASSGRRHVVRPGETLSEIAVRYGVSQEGLRQANSLRDPDLVLAGTSLSIPAR